DLLEVVSAGGSACRFTGLLDGGQQQCNEDGDDGDDDQEFDQRESDTGRGAFAVHDVHCVQIGVCAGSRGGGREASVPGGTGGFGWRVAEFGGNACRSAICVPKMACVDFGGFRGGS